MSSVGADFRYALRGFARSPLFTSIAVASLALGLGANTAIFSLMDQVMLRPLPVQEPSRLVMLEDPGPNQGRFSGDNSDRLFSYPAYKDLRDGSQVFDGLFARFGTGLNLSYKGRADHASGELVSGNFFDVLRVKPEVGRLFTPEDDVHKGGHPLVVLSHGFWARRFGMDRGIIGQAIRVNSSLMTVIGVAPKGFFGVDVGRAPDIYLPLTMKAQATPTWDMFEKRDAHYIHVLGRLKPGISREQAQASLQPLFHTVQEADLANLQPKDITERFKTRFLAKPLLLKPAPGGVPSYREERGVPIQVMMAMVGLVLLIACANVANLLMARALGRQREIAIRLSLGATRAGLIRQFLVESVALASLGAAVGLVIASWTADLLIRSLPNAGQNTAITSALDMRAVVFCALLSVLTGIIFGVMPALQATKPNVNSVMKEQAGAVVGGFRQIRSRQALVVAQVSLSLLLLIGAGLFTRSLMNLRGLDPGFQTNNLAIFSADAAQNGYDPTRVHQLYESLQDRLVGLPGSRSVSASDIVLLSGDSNSSTVHVEGYHAKQEEDMNPRFQSVLPRYFETMSIPVLQGREFNRSDRLGSRKVVIVNETFAKQYFGSASPLGRRIGIGGEKDPLDIEIVGVVKDGKYDSLRNKKMRVIYMAFAQEPQPGFISFTVRTSNKPEAVLPEVRRAVAQVDPTLALWDVSTMEAQVEESLFVERMIATLCACFGLLATVLAAVGLYGVMAFSVARRTREIGIRMALGAARSLVLRVVLQEVAILCLTGVAIGLPISAGLSRYIESQLYGVKPTDPLVMTGAALFLILVSLAAGYIPARRAATVDPMIALRYE